MAQGQPCNAIHPLHPDRDNSDGEFVRKAIAGEPLATDMLYRRHAHRLVMLATHLLANRADAEDAVQDAFIEAFRDLEKLREHAAFAPWITRITVHQVHRRYRRRRLRRIVGMLSPGSAEHGLLASARPELSPELHAELALIDAALRVVPPKHKVPWTVRRGLHLGGGCRCLCVLTCKCKATRTTGQRRCRNSCGCKGVIEWVGAT